MTITLKYSSVKRNFILDSEYAKHYKAGNLRKMARNAFLPLVPKIQASKCCHFRWNAASSKYISDPSLNEFHWVVYCVKAYPTFTPLQPLPHLPLHVNYSKSHR